MTKTTLAQAIMHLETDSFLGPTLCPHNRTLTAGGSSGGEGALIGAGGSALGYVIIPLILVPRLTRPISG